MVGKLRNPRFPGFPNTYNSLCVEKKKESSGSNNSLILATVRNVGKPKKSKDFLILSED